MNMRNPTIQSVLVVMMFGGVACYPMAAVAGSYLFSDVPFFGVDSITHPSGYNGTGGELEVEVCIDASAADAQEMTVAVTNIIITINQFTPTSPNLIFAGANNIPSNAVDFESLTLHELGHCVGLAHPNLGVQTGVAGDDTDLTATTKGDDGDFSLGGAAAGDDVIYGSADDQRGDDINLNWFNSASNNPFAANANPSAANFSRDVLDLPGGNNFVANAGRDVGAGLGVSNSEAVMQQGQFFDEDQRKLAWDDFSTLKYAQNGFDEIPGTADDYTLKLVYGGIKQDLGSCDIVIESGPVNFGLCFAGGTNGPGFGDHAVVTTATYTYNKDFNFFFNDEGICDAGMPNITFNGVAQSDVQMHSACESITYANFNLTSAGQVTAIAPTVTLNAGTSVSGTFRVITSASN